MSPVQGRGLVQGVDLGRARVMVEPGAGPGLDRVKAERELGPGRVRALGWRVVRSGRALAGPEQALALRRPGLGLVRPGRTRAGRIRAYARSGARSGA